MNVGATDQADALRKPRKELGALDLGEAVCFR
jgi:hypothetical protein